MSAIGEHVLADRQSPVHEPGWDAWQTVENTVAEWVVGVHSLSAAG